jgi:hypothetical protein
MSKGENIEEWLGICSQLQKEILKNEEEVCEKYF